jgi:anaerobic magnesium-protoporphyrin IX monomethyl ester cyclase
MKVLLLNPPMDYGAYNEAGRLYLDKSYPPLGLAYIAAILKTAGYEAKVFDLIDVPFFQAEKLIRKEEPDVVGISCNLTDYRWGAFKLAQIVRRLNPKTKVVMGGSHATHLYAQVLNNFSVDIIVRFEGEETFLELIKALEAKTDLRSVKGIAFRLGSQIIKTDDRPPIDNLDSLPFPLHSSNEFHRYIHYSAPASFKGKTVGKLKSVNIMASRGCPHNCVYCSIAQFWPRKCRLRSPKNVVDEMQALYEKFGVMHFTFFDDLFTLNQQRVIEICKEILNRKLNVCWECVTRVDLISEELLAWMKKAGCVSISYGVESGSDVVLKAINKRQSRAQVAKAFQMTHAAEIKAYILLMIGNFKESERTIKDTISLVRAIEPDKIRTTLTQVYPATDLYEFCKQKGVISDAYWLSDKAAPIFTVESSVKQLKKWESKINYAYYLQKKKVLRIYEILFYRNLFRNLREMLKSLFPKIDPFLEKIEHTLHST